MRHIVERIVLDGAVVRSIRIRMEARPFYEDLGDCMAVAPPDGRGGSKSKSVDLLAWYARAG